MSKKGMFLINSLAGGGAERVFSKLIKMISEDTARYEIHVVLLDIEKEEYPLPDGINVHRLGGSKLAGLYKLLKLTRRLRPSFIFSFLTRSNVFNIFLGSISSHKILINERSNTKKRIRGNFKHQKKYLLSATYSRADVIACCSQGIHDGLNKDFNLDISKLVVINNAYNIEHLEEQSNTQVQLQEKYVVAVGRLTKEKGFIELISAFASLDTNIRLKILGQGPLLLSLKQIAQKCGVIDRVDFMGFVSNPYPIIKNAECYVLSSHCEGFPNSLAEAMALSIPVIATNCFDGPSEILNYHRHIAQKEVIHAPYGLLVNTGDIPAMSNAMTQLLNDKALSDHYSKQSLIRAKEYSEDIFYDKYSHLINQNICA